MEYLSPLVPYLTYAIGTGIAVPLAYTGISRGRDIYHNLRKDPGDKRNREVAVLTKPIEPDHFKAHGSAAQHVLRKILNAIGTQFMTNVVVIGDPGTGKSTMIRSLAGHPRLKGRKVIEFNLEHLQQKQQGAGLLEYLTSCNFENAFWEFFGALQRQEREGKRFVLFIDDGKLLFQKKVWARARPVLSRNQIPIVIALTKKEWADITNPYMSIDESDLRRWTRIQVDPLTADETIEALWDAREEYEQLYGVQLSRDAIEALIWLVDLCEVKQQMGVFPDMGARWLRELCVDVVSQVSAASGLASSGDKIERLLTDDDVDPSQPNGRVQITQNEVIAYCVDVMGYSDATSRSHVQKQRREREYRRKLLSNLLRPLSVASGKRKDTLLGEGSAIGRAASQLLNLLDRQPIVRLKSQSLLLTRRLFSAIDWPMDRVRAFDFEQLDTYLDKWDAELAVQLRQEINRSNQPLLLLIHHGDDLLRILEPSRMGSPLLGEVRSPLIDSELLHAAGEVGERILDVAGQWLGNTNSRSKVKSPATEQSPTRLLRKPNLGERAFIQQLISGIAEQRVCLVIETTDGQSADLSIPRLSRQEQEQLLRAEFPRLANNQLLPFFHLGRMCNPERPSPDGAYDLLARLRSCQKELTWEAAADACGINYDRAEHLVAASKLWDLPLLKEWDKKGKEGLYDELAGAWTRSRSQVVVIQENCERRREAVIAHLADRGKVYRLDLKQLETALIERTWRRSDGIDRMLDELCNWRRFEDGSLLIVEQGDRPEHNLLEEEAVRVALRQFVLRTRMKVLLFEPLPRGGERSEDTSGSSPWHPWIGLASQIPGLSSWPIAEAARALTQRPAEPVVSRSQFLGLRTRLVPLGHVSDAERRWAIAQGLKETGLDDKLKEAAAHVLPPLLLREKSLEKIFRAFATVPSDSDADQLAEAVATVCGIEPKEIAYRIEPTWGRYLGHLGRNTTEFGKGTITTGYTFTTQYLLKPLLIALTGILVIKMARVLAHRMELEVRRMWAGS